MQMWRYVALRFVLLIPVLIGVTFIVFVVSRVIPADPVATVLGARATEEQARELRREWGLDRPLPVQYVRFLKGLLSGDWGTSLYTRRPVLDDLKEYLPATLELTTLSILISFVIGVILGTISASYRDKLADHVTRLFSLVGASTPVFWLGLLLLQVFYYWLGWFPGGGRIDPTIARPTPITGMYLADSLLTRNWEALFSSMRHIILPALCLSYVCLASISRVTRSSMLDVISADYVRTARAKGLPELVVIYKHALRNAIIPVITIAGIMYGQLLAGAVLTETIFSWPGMGRYAVRSITFLDFQPILGFTTVVCIVFVLVNLAVDILYVMVNPQIRYKL